ncbi:hypothetical protein QYF61_019600 [Mycteria americana]|uniref:Wnt inhibitory factor 1 n=1 Tax=Mycteria americana TaxID=33587 RepID=A0AAN7S9G5_MYCAM|nr:hypothetical protein QYF61_019600 [Mycteria americana]
MPALRMDSICTQGEGEGKLKTPGTTINSNPTALMQNEENIKHIPVNALIKYETKTRSTKSKLRYSHATVASRMWAEYFYEFLSLRSLDKGIMADPTINIPLLGTVPHKASVVQVGFPCLGKQDGVAAFEVNVIIMNSEGNIILQTPQNAIFFKTCQQALCAPRCMNGGLCITPGLCICPPGFYGINCDKDTKSGQCCLPHEGRCRGLRPLFLCFRFLGKCHQPCRNGGKCTGKNKCKCSKGYQGDLCSKPVCEPGCGLYGTCAEPNRCQCKEGWHGRHCNKRYGASGLSALRPAGSKHRQHTPSPKRAEERHVPPESNYIW